MGALTDQERAKLPDRSKAQKQATEEALQQIIYERERQWRKWGPQYHRPVQWMAILTEELGEASREALHLEFDDPDWESDFHRINRMRQELIQVAAVAIAAYEQLTARHPV